VNPGSSDCAGRKRRSAPQSADATAAGPVDELDGLDAPAVGFAAGPAWHAAVTKTTKAMDNACTASL
jgi:hypothetical protein